MLAVNKLQSRLCVASEDAPIAKSSSRSQPHRLRSVDIKEAGLAKKAVHADWKKASYTTAPCTERSRVTNLKRALRRAQRQYSGEEKKGEQ